MRILCRSTLNIPSRAAQSVSIVKMCQAFAQNGHDVILVLNDDNSAVSFDELCRVYGVEGCFKMVRIPRAAHFLPKIRYYLSILKVRTLMHDFHPDVLYFRQIPECYFQLCQNIKFIFEIHQMASDFSRSSQWMLRRISRSENLFKFVVITAALRDHYEKRYPWLNHKLVVAPDGADLCATSIATDGSRSGDWRMQAGYVGHLYQGKGMELISQIAPRCLWADFHVVGGMEGDICYWKDATSGSKNLHFHGFAPQADVASWLSKFDVCLLPNQRVVRIFGANKHVDIGSCTSPLKMFEYMSAGKPIIASDIPVLREVLEHDHTAFLCPPDDIDSWVRALTLLRDDGAIRSRLGRDAQIIFKERYTWKHRAERILSSEVN